VNQRSGEIVGGSGTLPGGVLRETPAHAGDLPVVTRRGLARGFGHALAVARANVPDWQLRPISPTEFEWAFELHRAALGEYVDQTWGWDEAVQRRLFAGSFDRRPLQVIEVDGTGVGVLEVDERPDELVLGLVELLPAWQNKGLGTDILRWLLRRAHETHRTLGLSVLNANPRAAALYEREGLRVVGSGPAKLQMRGAP